MIPGTAFGLDYKYETNYRQLAKQFESESKGNWVVMPPYPMTPMRMTSKRISFRRSRHPLRINIISERIPSAGTLRRDWFMVSGLQFSFHCCFWHSIMEWGSASGVPWDFGVVNSI